MYRLSTFERRSRTSYIIRDFSCEHFKMNKNYFSGFVSFRYFVRLFAFAVLFFLFYQFYVATILWRYQSSTVKYILTDKLSSLVSNTLLVYPSQSQYGASSFPVPVPGVLQEKQHLYEKTNNSIFMCIESGTIIDYVKVNDDYCDCEDFSDEPSTSACVGGKFFCPLFNVKVYDLLPSSRVNDGICDCCDGSDEWKSIPVPYHMKIFDAVQEKLRTFQVPCKNFCV